MEFMAKHMELLTEDKKMANLCIANCTEGFVKIKNGVVVAYDRQADYLLELSKHGDDIECILGKENYRQLLAGGHMKEKIANRYLAVTGILCNRSNQLFIVKDLSIEENMRFELHTIQQINKELQHIFETYNDNTLYVCDATGKTLWVGADLAANCGVTKEYIESRTVQELEEEGVFYPSVSAMVLKSKKAEVVSQITGTGKTGVSIGIPMFNTREELTHVIALTKDLRYTLKVGQLLSDLGHPKESKEPDFVEMVSCSPASIALTNQIRNTAKVNVTVLIVGEEGSGKDVVANMLHKLGRRKLRPLNKINCTELSPGQQAKALFGTTKGGGALDSNGIVYIDGIEVLSMNCQKKLLAYLQKQIGVERTNAPRLFFSSSADLKKLVEENQFSKELYQWISVITLEVSPLRDRKEDIPVLIRYFLAKCNEKYQLEKEFSKEAMLAMEWYQWPGNIRELERVVEWAVVTSSFLLIQKEELPKEIAAMSPTAENVEGTGLSEAVELLEANMIREALQKYGNASLVANVLGVNQSTISRKMKKYGITSKR